MATGDANEARRAVASNASQAASYSDKTATAIAAVAWAIVYLADRIYSASA